jgi:hypothetical protein
MKKLLILFFVLAVVVGIAAVCRSKMSNGESMGGMDERETLAA